jgi:hypothetical protein
VDFEMGMHREAKNGDLYDLWGNRLGRAVYDSKRFKETGHFGNSFLYFDQDYKVNGKVVIEAGTYKSFATGALYDKNGIMYGQVIPHGNLRRNGFVVNKLNRSPQSLPTEKQNPLQIKPDNH